MFRRYLPWILSLTIVTVMCVLVDVTVQQSYRMNANDPQIQLAEDMQKAFSNNQFTTDSIQSSFESFQPTNRQIDLATSLSAWIQLYDASGSLIKSSAIMSGVQTIPKIPKGIFTATDKTGEDRLTWEPQKGIRQAIVVTKFSGMQSGYVVAGRSLKEIEMREGNLNRIVAIVWFCLMCLIGISFAWTFGYLTRFSIQKTPRR